MKPLNLEMSAFGPYHKTEIIDFTQLENKKLFLITGPTGAGKTTIFDAISYALFGETNNHLRSSDGLRSQHSKEDLLTEVKFEFELHNKRYFVHRIPRQMKPKTKGQGFTEQKPYAELFLPDQEKPIVKVGNVNQKIESLIGLNAEQFRQIMMIPQGEFRKLLVADSQERESVLQKLFDTSLYHKIQDQLDQNAKELYNAIKESRRLQVHEVKSIQHHCEDLKTLIEATEPNIHEIVEKTQRLMNEDHEQANIFKLDLVNKKDDYQKYIQEKEVAKNTNDRFLEKEELEKKLSDLQAQGGLVKNKEDLVLQYKYVIRIKPYYESLLKRQNEIETSRGRLEGLQEELQGQKRRLINLKDDYAQYTSNETKALLEAMVNRLSELKAYVSKVEAFETLDDQLAACKKELEAKGKKVTQMAHDLSALDVRKSDLTDKILQSKEAQIDVLKKKNQLQTHEDKLSSLLKVTDLKRKLQTAERTCQKAQNRLDQENLVHKKLSLKYQETKAYYHLNLAAVLAKDLKDDQACPVCGSLDHKKLADYSGEFVDENQVNRLEKEVKKAAEVMNAASDQLILANENVHTIKMNLEDLLETSDSDFDEEVLRDKIKALKKKIKALESIANAHDQHNRDLKDLHDKEKSMTLDLEGLRGQMTVDENHVIGLQTKLDFMFNEVPKAYHKIKPLKEEIYKTQREKALLEEKINDVIQTYNKTKESFLALETSVKTHEEHLNTLKDASLLENEVFEGKLVDGGIGSLTKYVELLQEVDQVDRLERVIAEFYQKQQVYTSKLKDLDLFLKDKRFVDVGAIEDKIRGIIERIEEVQLQVHEYESRIKHNERVINNIGLISNRIEATEKKYEVIGHMARVANGRNQKNMTFERYVLAAFLDDILRASNTRLMKMTSGRYKLVRSELLERKNKQSGLDLEVFDHYTGKQRHVKTLSGGESFKTSLAMALGLSDVVQSYAGGVKLDTMFIDEGFGTLDQESLDSAINCLIDIQNQGRLVGIISHVQELKERIETKLEVISKSNGSETVFHL